MVVAFRGRTVLFGARADLPGPAADAEQARAEAAHLAGIVVRQGAEAAAVIGYGVADRVTPAVLRVSAGLAAPARPGGRRVPGHRRAVLVVPVHRPGLLPGGRARPAGPRSTAVAAQATYAGQVVLPDRAALVGAARPVTGAGTDGDVRRHRAGPGPAGRGAAAAAGRVAPAGRRSRTAETRYRSGDRLTDDEVAWLGAAAGGDADPRLRVDADGGRGLADRAVDRRAAAGRSALRAGAGLACSASRRGAGARVRLPTRRWTGRWRPSRPTRWRSSSATSCTRACHPT